MGKRCETINNGKPCNYLAQDGSCLCAENELKEKCPARETVEHEDKDEWMTEQETREFHVSPYQGKE